MSDEDHVAVVSVVVRDGAQGSRILLGVRRPVAASQRHPGVLSTLTMRVPRAYLDSALEELSPGVRLPQAGRVLRFDNDASFRVGAAEGFRFCSVFLVESLLARKLEIGAELVLGRVTGSLVGLGVATDVVEDPKGGFGPELTTMLTYRLDLDRGSQVLVGDTSSYAPVAWAEGRDLWRAVSSNDALMLMPELDPFEVCLHGLCVRSAAQLMAFE